MVQSRPLRGERHGPLPLTAQPPQSRSCLAAILRQWMGGAHSTRTPTPAEPCSEESGKRQGPISAPRKTAKAATAPTHSSCRSHNTKHATTNTAASRETRPCTAGHGRRGPAPPDMGDAALRCQTRETRPCTAGHGRRGPALLEKGDAALHRQTRETRPCTAGAHHGAMGSPWHSSEHQGAHGRPARSPLPRGTWELKPLLVSRSPSRTPRTVTGQQGSVYQNRPRPSEHQYEPHPRAKGQPLGTVI